MSLEQKPKRILKNRYRLVEVIGTGAMGEVYLAKDESLGGVTVAVKFLSQTLLNDKMRDRFETEAKISALLGEKSIHIVKVREYGFDENKVPFYVMEFLDGQSLSEIIKFQPLSLKKFLHITRQICLGLDSAHKGIDLDIKENDQIICKKYEQIIHRDIKPSNIYVVQDPTLHELVKILDFGVARLVEANATQTHSFMGTLAYCSPEQMEGKKLDNRSDIYSLGVMMYEMLTLEMPILPESSSFGGWYRAHHQSEPRPFESHLKLPPALTKIIMRCMAKSPSDRPQSVGEILNTIQEIEQDNSRYSSRFNNYNADKTLVEENPEPEEVSSPLSSSRRRVNDTISWPSNKPLQKIVFPRVITNSLETFIGLWVMLNKQDIVKRKSSIRYNQFLFLNSPHPMVLWITVIYNPEYGARWLPCYLDLKTHTGQQVLSTLAEIGSYKIFFFALEEPENCQHTLISTIAPRQCAIMKQWLESSRILPDQKQSLGSKRRLKNEFNKLKPKILDKLQQKAQN